MLSECIKSVELWGVGPLLLVPMIHFRSPAMSSGMLKLLSAIVIQVKFRSQVDVLLRS